MPPPEGNTLLLFAVFPTNPAHRQNMADEDEERESDEENLLSQSQELQRLAVDTPTGNEWKIIGYLQYCKFDLRQIAVC